MPEITDEEKAVIEAAEALFEGRCGGTGPKEFNMMKALWALAATRATPYVPLLSDKEANEVYYGRSGSPMVTQACADIGVMYLRKAAERLAYDGQSISNTFASYLRDWADEEEKLAK